MATTFFVLGVLATLWLIINSVHGPGDDKRGVVAFPFLLFIAAAVAKYIFG